RPTARSPTSATSFSCSWTMERPRSRGSSSPSRRLHVGSAGVRGRREIPVSDGGEDTMKKPTSSNRVDPDGIRIVEKSGGRAPRAGWTIGALAIVMAGGIALRMAPWSSQSPAAPTANAPAATEARPDRSHAAQAASRGTRTARAVPAAPTENHMAEQAEREIAEAARELAAATPQRAEELRK